MQRVLLGVFACVLGLALAGATQAHEQHHPHPVVVAHGGPAYYAQHGVHFHGGYYYPGHDHCHWTRRVWDPVCHRYNYFDPSLNCYYYWNPTLNGYYPVGY
jgi:hypothetical protein